MSMVRTRSAPVSEKDACAAHSYVYNEGLSSALLRDGRLPRTHAIAVNIWLPTYAIYITAGNERKIWISKR